MASKLSVFLAELKRRKVTRVAVVYALVGLGVIEGASMILPTLQLEAANDYIVIFVLFGFPIALVLAWALEVTPEGIQKTVELTPEQFASRTPEEWSVGTWVLLGVGALLVLGAGYFAFFRGPGAVVLPEGRVAVFPFENLTGDASLDALGPSTAHWVTDGLSRVEGVEVLATSAVLQAVQSRNHGITDLEIAAALGAGTLVSGVITSRGEDLEISAQITEVSSGNVLRSPGASGPGVQKMEVVDELRDRVMGSLALSLDDVRLSAPNPPTYEAYQAFLRGLTSFLLGDFEACATAAEEAHRLDPTFLTVLALESGCLRNSGRRTASDSVLAIMEARRDEMAPFDRLQLEYERAWSEGSLEEMLRVNRLMAREDPFANTTLAFSAIRVARPAEALQAFSEVPAMNPAPWAEAESALPGLPLIANMMLGQFDLVLDRVAQGRATPGFGLWARQLEIHALIGLGRLEEIQPILDEIGRMEPETGWSRLSPASVYRNVAAVLARFGYSEESRETAGLAEAWCRTRGPDGYRSAMAQALLLAGQPEEAAGLLIQLVQDAPGNLTARRSLGIALALMGDKKGARAQAQWIEDSDSASVTGSHSYSRAAILAHLEQRDEAVRLLRQALAEGRAHYYVMSNTFLWWDPNFRPLWGFDPFEQLVAPKG